MAGQQLGKLIALCKAVYTQHRSSLLRGMIKEVDGIDKPYNTHASAGLAQTANRERMLVHAAWKSGLSSAVAHVRDHDCCLLVCGHRCRHCRLSLHKSKLRHQQSDSEPCPSHSLELSVCSVRHGVSRGERHLLWPSTTFLGCCAGGQPCGGSRLPRPAPRHRLRSFCKTPGRSVSLLMPAKLAPGHCSLASNLD